MSLATNVAIYIRMIEVVVLNYLFLYNYVLDVGNKNIPSKKLTSYDLLKNYDLLTVAIHTD